MTLPTPSRRPSRAGLTPRQRRALGIALAVTVLASAIGLVLYALSANIVFFYTPTQVAAHEAPQGRPFRIGGLVGVGSVVRAGVVVRFTITDGAHTMPVQYQGTLPDLFREGKGVVAQGRMGPDSTFQASEVLAKHDENYMPPEAAAALKQAGHPMQLPSLQTP